MTRHFVPEWILNQARSKIKEKDQLNYFKLSG